MSPISRKKQENSPGIALSALAGVRVVALDWGGTLVHVARQEATRAACAAAAAEFCRTQGWRLEAGAEDALLASLQAQLALTERADCLSELDTTGLLAAWCARHELPLADGHGERLADALWRPWVGCLDLIPGVAGVLGALRAQGFTLGLVSNCATAPAVCRAELQRLGIADEFAFTLFSSEIGFRKPHPRIYDETLARARSIHADLRPGEVLFVGDTPIADIEGPRIAGMHTALVAPGAGNADVAACRPDGTLESILDLPRLLGSKIVGMGP